MLNVENVRRRNESLYKNQCSYRCLDGGNMVAFPRNTKTRETPLRPKILNRPQPNSHMKKKKENKFSDNVNYYST